MYLDWDDKYSVGVDIFDQQHRKIFFLINDLYYSIKSGVSQEITLKTLEELINYTLVHFPTEEKDMLEYEYPEYEVHQQEHQDFLSWVKEFKMNFETGDSLLTTEIMGFLVSWLTNHISVTDKKCGLYLNEKGVK